MDNKLTIMLRVVLAALIVALAGTPPVAADELRVAVASNFRYAMEEIVPLFEKRTGHVVTPVFGSTGKHFAQIGNGAPFDVFLAADELRPRMLEEDGLVVSGSRFIYAIGKLVLWSPVAESAVGNERLLNGEFRFLAIANPTFAPYGRAARQALQGLAVWEKVYPRIVRGENVSQAYQFVVSGNAELGLIALSQIRIPGAGTTGSHWLVPATLYDPIRQQAAVLTDQPAAHEFAEFLSSTEAQEVIRSYGYDTP